MVMNLHRIVIALMLLTAPLAVAAQQASKIPKVRIVQVGAAAAAQHFLNAFKQGMRERGYVEGQNVIFVHRSGENNRERLSEAAAELVRLKVDVIVTSTDEGVASVKQHTQMIPIVMANSTDPVGTGFIASLARPGRNITGHSAMSPELNGKRLELLRAVVPGLSRVGILWNPELRGAVLDYKETETAARALHLQLVSVEVTRAQEFDRAFSTLAANRVQGLIVPAVNPIAFANRSALVKLAETNRLPSIYGVRDFAIAGGLMAYGPNAEELWRHAATYVDKILKGAKAAELPVEQPTKFELVINLKTAKALGLTIPQALLQQADQVIQ